MICWTSRSSAWHSMEPAMAPTARFGAENFLSAAFAAVSSVRAWLRPVNMPGGDAAARFPAQAAAAFVGRFAAMRPDLARLPTPDAEAILGCDENDREERAMFSLNVDGPAVRRGRSAARVSCANRRMKGKPRFGSNIKRANAAPQPPYPFPDLDHRPLIRAILDDRIAGRNVCEIAAAFHAASAAAVVEHVSNFAKQHQLRTVALSGGVFQNELLLGSIVARLTSESDMRC